MSKPPKGKGWERVPSVTTGGKAYFYFRRVGQVRQWYVWDRIAQAYIYRIDAPKRGVSNVH